jgi:hypothetical protein
MHFTFCKTVVKTTHSLLIWMKVLNFPLIIYYSFLVISALFIKCKCPDVVASHTVSLTYSERLLIILVFVFYCGGMNHLLEMANTDFVKCTTWTCALLIIFNTFTCYVKILRKM